MQCNFKKEDQKRCNANAMIDNGFCFSHNPLAAEAKKVAVDKGGKSSKKNHNSLPPLELNSVRNVVNLLSTAINEVRGGKIELRVANCVGYLSGHLIKALEIADLEERFENLEKVVKILSIDKK